MRKNVASQHISFQMNSAATGSAVTSGTPTVYYTIDAGTQGTGGGSAVHEGNGQWSYAPVQAETNGAHVAFTMVLASAVSQTVNVWPVAYNPGDSVRLGITALPDNAADAAGGLPISDAGGLDLDALNTAAVRLTAERAQVLTDWINAGRLDAILDIIAGDVENLDGDAMRGTDSANTTTPPTAAAIVNEWETQSQADPTGFHVNILEVGGTSQTANDNGADINTLVSRVTAAVATATALGTAQGDLDTLTGTDGATLATSQPNYVPAVAGDLMGLVNDAITLAKFDESTAFPLGSVDSGSTEVARTGADSDTLETLSDQVDAVPTAAEIATTQLIESYAVDGVSPTFAQALLGIQQMLQEMTIAGTTMTIKKLDGSTTAFTLTLDADPPTSVTRTS